MKQKETVGFEFTEIPLDEARNIVMAGGGNYAHVKAHLLETLPKLDSDKAFAFGLPNGQEIPEVQRKGLQLAVNATLSKAGMDWKVSYSDTRKLFICVPKNGVTKIVRHYTKREKIDPPSSPGRLQTKDDKLSESQGEELVRKIVLDAAQAFKTPGADIVRGVGPAKAIRKAVCIVAYRLNVSPEDIGAVIGLSKSGVKFNVHTTSKYGHDQLAVLSKLYPRGI